MPPLTASTSRLASGLHASASACGSFELTARGLVDGDGVVLIGLVAGEAVATGLPPIGTVTLIGWMTGPWSGLDTATCVPSALIAIGPSSGPSLRGNA